MLKNKTLVITGLGRCGTSLAMQLLEASGVPCHGKYPAFEEDDVYGTTSHDPNILQKLKGRAVKIIDPHLTNFDFTDCCVVYLERDIKEQARSQIKMARTFFDLGSPTTGTSRAEMRGMSALLKRDNKKCIEMFRNKVPLLFFKFEQLIESPHIFIHAVGVMCKENMKLPADSGIVYPRSPKCHQGFIEIDLIQKSR